MNKLTKTRDGPKDYLRAYFDTVLQTCPGTSDRFYSWQSIEDYPRSPASREIVFDWRVIQYRGPFSYARPPSIKDPSPAQKVNGLFLWKARQTFQSTIYRESQLHAIINVSLAGTTITQAAISRNSSKTVWGDGSWHDTQPPASEFYIGAITGTLTADITKYSSQIVIDSGWVPVSCDVATAADPFPNYPVAVQ